MGSIPTFHSFALVSRQSEALNSATQQAMHPEFCRKWGTESLNSAVCGIQREAEKKVVQIYEQTNQEFRGHLYGVEVGAKSITANTGLSVF